MLNGERICFALMQEISDKFGESKSLYHMYETYKKSKDNSKDQSSDPKNVDDDDESQLDLDDLKNLIEGGNVPKKSKVKKSEIVENTNVLEKSPDTCNQSNDNSVEIKSDTPAKSTIPQRSSVVQVLDLESLASESSLGVVFNVKKRAREMDLQEEIRIDLPRKNRKKMKNLSTHLTEESVFAENYVSEEEEEDIEESPVDSNNEKKSKKKGPKKNKSKQYNKNKL